MQGTSYQTSSSKLFCAIILAILICSITDNIKVVVYDVPDVGQVDTLPSSTSKHERNV